MPSVEWERLAESMEAAAERLSAARKALEAQVESQCLASETRPALTVVEGGKDD